MYNPLISVIIPVYNAEQYLDECVGSVVGQTYANLEIILVDDGSADNSPQMCDTWAKNDSRIRVVHKENGGASSARNAGLDIAKGDYIGFVDSDDYIAEDMYERLFEALNGTEIKISCCCMQRVFAVGKISEMVATTSKKVMDTTDAINELFFTECTSVCDKLFETSVFEGIRFPNGEINEEFSILIPLIAGGGGMVRIENPLYYYRAREGSVTNSHRYLQEFNSRTVYNNLIRIEGQIEKYALSCEKSFRFFSASSAYNMAISMEKRYPQLNSKVKADYSIYRGLMKKNIVPFLFSRYSRFKDKILYLMILAKILRPMYKIFYKNHL